MAQVRKPPLTRRTDFAKKKTAHITMLDRYSKILCWTSPFNHLQYACAIACLMQGSKIVRRLEPQSTPPLWRSTYWLIRAVTAFRRQTVTGTAFRPVLWAPLHDWERVRIKQEERINTSIILFLHSSIKQNCKDDQFLFTSNQSIGGSCFPYYMGPIF